jgi:Uma2 family endonuclease
MIISTAIESKTYTAEEYLASEIESEFRHEYRNGEIVQMTGGTPNHNEITGNLIFLLKAALPGKVYTVFVTDQRLWIPERKMYTYPDVMIMQRPVALQMGHKDTVMNPILIAEVLSASTGAYDRGDKFEAYRTSESFQEYLLIDQSQMRVEQFFKQSANQWLFTEHKGGEARLALESGGVEIGLAALYENVEF